MRAALARASKQHVLGKRHYSLVEYFCNCDGGGFLVLVIGGGRCRLEGWNVERAWLKSLVLSESGSRSIGICRTKEQSTFECYMT